jgi:membrane-bound lytic murein transglycosylase D
MPKTKIVSLLFLTAAGCSTIQRAPSPEKPAVRPTPVSKAKTASTATVAGLAQDQASPEADLDDAGVAEALARLAEAGGKSGEVATSIDDPWLREEIARAIGDFGKDEERAIPDGLVRAVSRCAGWLVHPGPGRVWLDRSLHRMDAYAATVRAIFVERDLPPLLDHLALVESGYQPHARSKAGAAGMWQFMPATARRYGLDVDRSTDDRLDPVKATVAAREYLLDLLLEFGSGHDALLAVAAYNAGEGRIRSVLRQLHNYRERSFWNLAEHGLLPTETKMYVPMILAVTIVATHRERFGFSKAELAAAMPVDAPHHTARALTVHERSPKAAPKPLRYLVRPRNTATAIAAAFGVPRSVVEKAAGPRGKLHSGQILELPISGWERTSHRVRKGDSLERIAKKHGTSVQALCTFNGLPSTRIVAGDLLAIYRRAQPLSAKPNGKRSAQRAQHAEPESGRTRES